MAADHEGFCVKCRAKKAIVDPQQVDMKNGRQAIRGRCPDCNTGMYKILAKVLPAQAAAASPST